MNNNMAPQNSLFLTENGGVTTLGQIIKDSISAVTGGAADNIELSANDTHILWKLQSEADWKELIALSVITGPQGPQGQKGATGAKGADGWGTKAEYDALVARIEALENPTA